MLVLGTRSYGFNSRYSEMKNWKPEKENEYKLIKKKWLLEILTGRKIQINKEKGYLINNINNHWSNQYLGNPILLISHLFYE
jgi:hypothetical protein